MNIPMFKETENGLTEIGVLPAKVERMKELGWTEEKPKPPEKEIQADEAE